MNIFHNFSTILDVSQLPEEVIQEEHPRFAESKAPQKMVEVIAQAGVVRKKVDTGFVTRTYTYRAEAKKQEKRLETQLEFLAPEHKHKGKFIIGQHTLFSPTVSRFEATFRQSASI